MYDSCDICRQTMTDEKTRPLCRVKLLYVQETHESCTLWHEIFAGSNFFAIFPAIRKNKFPQIKTIRNIFSEKIYSRVNIKFATQNTIQKHRACSIATCVFHYETKPYTMNYWFDHTQGTHTVVLFENMYSYQTHFITKTKISLMLGTWCFLKTAKVNSQQENLVCSNRKNQFPQT